MTPTPNVSASWPSWDARSSRAKEAACASASRSPRKTRSPMPRSSSTASVSAASTPALSTRAQLSPTDIQARRPPAPAASPWPSAPVPAALAYARLVEKHSPSAWLVNFTNPAGLITQAISHSTGARVVGICDTPDELFHRIATALDASPDRVHCDYLGLNHLGWVRRVLLDGKDVTAALLEDDKALAQLYTGSLFDHDLLRALGLIPTEYLYFYYSRRRALANQQAVGTTRGEEVARLNVTLLSSLQKHIQSGDMEEALAVYTAYLNQRSNSYMKLEADRGSAFDDNSALDQNPFRSATGYHRIAINVMKALSGAGDQRIVVNVPNHGAIEDVDDHDIVEVPCAVSLDSIQPESCGRLPEAVRGLVLAVKAYEKAAMEAAISGSSMTARKAMLLYPPIGEWEPAKALLDDMIDHNTSLEYLRTSHKP